MENSNPYNLRPRAPRMDDRDQQPTAGNTRPTSASAQSQATEALNNLKATVTLKLTEINNVLENSTTRIQNAESDEYSDTANLTLAATHFQLNQLHNELTNMDAWLETQINNHPAFNNSEHKENYLREVCEHLYASNPLAIGMQIQARTTDIELILVDKDLGTPADLLTENRENGKEDDIRAIMEANTKDPRDGNQNAGELNLDEEAPDGPARDPPSDGHNEQERFQSAPTSMHDGSNSSDHNVNNLTDYDATFASHLPRVPNPSDGEPSDRRGTPPGTDRRDAELARLQKELEQRTREVQELEVQHQLAQEASRAQRAKDAEMVKSNQKLAAQEMARLKHQAQTAQTNLEKERAQSTETAFLLEQAKNYEANLRRNLERAQAQSRELEDQLRQSRATHNGGPNRLPANQGTHPFESSSDNGSTDSGPRPTEHRFHSTLNLAHESDQTPILEAPRIHMSPIQENPTSLRQILAEMANLKDMVTRGQEDVRRAPQTPRPIPFEIRKPRVCGPNSCPGIKKIQDAVQAIPQYSGDDKSNFRTFRDRVIKLVHDNGAFDMVQKGLILEQLLTGKARDCIASADNAEKAYTRTFELLCQTYGNEENTEEEVLARFRELDLDFYAVIDNTLQQLSKHAALTSQLSETAQEPSGTAKRLLLEKLPDDLRFELTRKERTLRDEGQPKLDMTETLEFVRCYLMDRKTANRHSASGLAPRAYRSVYYTEAQQQPQQTVMVTSAQHTTSASSGHQGGEQKRTVTQNRSYPNQTGKPKSASAYRTEARKRLILNTPPSWKLGLGPSMTTLQYIFPLQAPKDSLKCALCGTGHSITGCPLPPAEVRKRIEAEGRCIACGHLGHNGIDCTHTMLCAACQGRHVTAGCERKSFFMQHGNWPDMAVQPRQQTFFRGPRGQQ